MRLQADLFERAEVLSQHMRRGTGINTAGAELIRQYGEFGLQYSTGTYIYSSHSSPTQISQISSPSSYICRFLFKCLLLWLL